MTPALSASREARVSERTRKTACRQQLTLEVEEVTLSSADGLALADDHGLQHLLSELGLALLDGGQEHVSDGARGEAVQSGADAGAGDHVQVLSSSVVCAVHDRSHWQTVRNLQLDSVATSSACT